MVAVLSWSLTFPSGANKHLVKLQAYRLYQDSDEPDPERCKGNCPSLGDGFCGFGVFGGMHGSGLLDLDSHHLGQP